MRYSKDDAGLPIRVIADSLGQADINTTQGHYLARGKAHPEAAAVLDRALEHPANWWFFSGPKAEIGPKMT
ncbi:hypothetical protein [Mycobacteroides abscessus]|uniref:hypothetical protein n=1 Tax=Mycobacteroides abscessus TaxID=36809 RepID=UPI001F3B9472|nr:hypothetical protein [Mycobacteroides abscessus]